MTKRRVAITPPPDWEERDEATVHGRTLTKGTEVSILGERGRFRFIRQIDRPGRGLSWLEFWGGPKGYEQWRAFKIDRIKRVHRINTTGENLLKARKAS